MPNNAAHGHVVVAVAERNRRCSDPVRDLDAVTTLTRRRDGGADHLTHIQDQGVVAATKVDGGADNLAAGSRTDPGVVAVGGNRTSRDGAAGNRVGNHQVVATRVEGDGGAGDTATEQQSVVASTCSNGGGTDVAADGDPVVVGTHVDGGAVDAEDNRQGVVTCASLNHTGVDVH